MRCGRAPFERFSSGATEKNTFKESKALKSSKNHGSFSSSKTIKISVSVFPIRLSGATVRGEGMTSEAAESKAAIRGNEPSSNSVEFTAIDAVSIESLASTLPPLLVRIDARAASESASLSINTAFAVRAARKCSVFLYLRPITRSLCQKSELTG